MGKDTSYVMFACIMAQLLKNNNVTVIAAHDLHTNEFCVPINTSKMSLSYSLTFLLLVWLQSYCRKWTKKGGHVVYANKLVKIKNLLHVFIIFFDIQNIVIDTLYVIFACLVTELLQEMNQERRPFCLCKLHGQKLKNSFGNRVYRIQHTRIMLKSLVPNFYPKMPLEITFFQNPTRLWSLPLVFRSRMSKNITVNYDIMVW